MQSKERVFGLDIVRATAILLVMISHVIHLLPIPVGVQLFTFNYFGFLGVEIFFVLSGYLIGSIFLKIIIKSKTLGFIEIIKFWMRRWFRTIPNYFLVLILSFTLVYSFQNFDWHYLLFIQNFYAVHPAFFREAWSLSIEEWFYLLYPILTYLVIRTGLKLEILGNKKKAILLSLLIVILGVPLIRYLFPIEDNTLWDEALRKIVIFRLDSILYGVLIAFISVFYSDWLEKNKSTLFWVGTSGWILMTILFALYISSEGNSLFFRVFFLSINSLSLAFILPKLSHIKNPKQSAVTKVVTSISLWSYSLYLIHNTLILNFVEDLFDSTRWYHDLAKFTLFWIGSFFFSWILYFFYERPILNWRDRKVKQNYDL